MLRRAFSRAFSSMSKGPCRPLVAIVGATGTGKSDLAVDIARQFNGEIINGDAMQLYRGLPIITNKISQDEMKGVPHHLLGQIGLDEETWTVGKFVENALGVIEEIRSRGKLPILVGGTHYYTQSLLFQDTLADTPDLGTDGIDGGERFPILNEPTEVIMAELKEVDPVIASRWHPNDRRKIQRSLEICLRTGKPASQIYEEQRKHLHNGSLRFPTLLFWVHAPKEVLNPRLDARIENMLDRGLLAEVQELSDFRESREAETGQPVDQTRGIWASIGYKEYFPYQAALSSTPGATEILEKLKKDGTERTQAATRQYAKRQVRWISNKLLNALFGAGQNDKTFVLDGSDMSKWEESVVQPSRDITQRFLSGAPLPVPSDLSALATEMLVPKRDYDLSRRPDLWKARVCEPCGGSTFVTENDWNMHINSRGHRRMLNLKKKEAIALLAGIKKRIDALLAGLSIQKETQANTQSGGPNIQTDLIPSGGPIIPKSHQVDPANILEDSRAQSEGPNIRKVGSRKEDNAQSEGPYIRKLPGAKIRRVLL